VVDYSTAMRLPAKTLLYLFEVRQSVDFEERAVRIDDGALSAAAGGFGGQEAHSVMQARLNELDALATGQKPSPGYTQEATEL